MKTASGDTTNTATGHATVGAQTGPVHGDVNTFIAPPDASPEKKFEIGVNCLNSGIAPRARKYITEAVMEGHRTDKTVFYWIISLVSRRSRDELPDEDATPLWDECEKYRSAGAGEWTEAVSTVCHILEATERREGAESEIEVALKELDRVSPHKRALIVRHIEAFVSGPIRNGMWKRVVGSARSEQRVNDREDRVWKFFEPDPAGPRVIPAEPARVRHLTWIKAVAGTAVLAGATVYIDYVLVQFGQIPLLLVSLLSLTAGVLAARDSMEWRFRVVRRRTKEQQHETARGAQTRAHPGGFAQGVTDRFDHYFKTYVPDGTDRAVWLTRTDRIRRRLRDEIVELYREQRTDAQAVAWLIRHLVGKIRREWENGTLHAYRAELTTPTATKVTAALGVATLTGGGLLTLAEAITADPLHATYALFFLVLGGWTAVRAWSDIILEHRRARADKQERTHELAERLDAFARWTEKLKDRPTDQEISSWLECDQNLLLDEALHHHALPMSSMLAYTFLEAPASKKRARIKGGPWRYLRYQILVFILTKDGIRQLSVHLDTQHGTFHDREWTNYRYDALAAVHVEQADNQRRTVKLSLINGEEIEVTVLPDTDGATEEASTVTLEAAGIGHTLRILEGIAAEGKSWINHIHRHARTTPT